MSKLAFELGAHTYQSMNKAAGGRGAMLVKLLRRLLASRGVVPYVEADIAAMRKALTAVESAGQRALVRPVQATRGHELRVILPHAGLASGISKSVKTDEALKARKALAAAMSNLHRRRLVPDPRPGDVINDPRMISRLRSKLYQVAGLPAPADPYISAPAAATTLPIAGAAGYGSGKLLIKRLKDVQNRGEV